MHGVVGYLMGFVKIRQHSIEEYPGTTVYRYYDEYMSIS